MLTSGKSQGNQDELATLAGGRKALISPLFENLQQLPAAHSASRELVARCQERWIPGPALPLKALSP